MSYVYYNPNPKGKHTTDCVIRMLTKIFNLTWLEAYWSLSEVVEAEYEMPSSNYIWETYLEQHGFVKKLLPSHCPHCMTVRQFANYFNNDIYVACTGSHVIAVLYGDFFDTSDSGNEIVSYYFEKRKPKFPRVGFS